MVDLLKDWNPNKYLVDVVDDYKKEIKDGEEIIEEDEENEDKEEINMMIKIKNSWTNNMLSVINKLVALNFNFTNKKLIYFSIIIIIICILYFILYSFHYILTPINPPQEIIVKLIS